MAASPARSPLHDAQERRGASFVEWSGAQWADHFGDPVAEHHAVRTGAGVWDISPLHVWEARGAGARPAVDVVFTNPVEDTPPGRIRYGALCDEAGAMVNDATVFVVTPDVVWIITSQESDGKHLSRHLSGLEPIGHRLAKLQIQGPDSRALLSDLGAPVGELDYFRLLGDPIGVAGVACTLSRIGYSGELGYELFFTPGDAERVWKTLVDAGARPYGFAAVETLRIEAGLPLLGAEIIPGETSPYDLSLDHVVRPDNPDLIGREALAAAAQAPPRRLMALEVEGDAVPQRGTPVQSGTDRVGTVTSACASPTLGRVIALAILEVAAAADGAEVTLGEGTAATVRPVPLYDPERKRPRA